MARPDGYYWINCPDQGGWQIAEWSADHKSWCLCGSDVSVVEGDGWSEVTEVGDAIPPRTD